MVKKLRRICYVNPGINIRRPISQIMSFLKEKNYKVAILTPRKKKDKRREATRHYDDFKGIKLNHYPVWTRSSGYIWPVPINLEFIKKSWKILKENDIIHVWVPFYPNTFMICLLKLLFFKKKMLILTMDTFPGYSFKLSSFLDPIFKIFYRTIGKLSFLASNYIAIYGKSMVKYAKKAGLPPKKIVITPTGINLQLKDSNLNIREELNIKTDEKIALFIGLINYRKGIDTILRTAKLNKEDNIKFILVGDGPETNYSKKIISKLGLQNKVYLVGTRLDVHNFYKQADVFFLPSRGEGLAGVLMEALIYNLPVVTSDIAGTRDIISNMENGILCDVEDASAYSNAITSLIKNESLREKFKVNGLNTIKEKYLWQHNIKKFESIYEFSKAELIKVPKRLKILLISPSPPNYLGGLSLFTRDLALNLADHEIQVDFLCSSLTKKSAPLQVYSKNVRVLEKKCFLLADNKNAFRIKNPVFNVLTYLIKYGKNYDLIHVHSYIYFSTMQTLLYKLVFNRKVPVILHLHGGIQTSDYQPQLLIEKFLLLFKKYIFDLTIGKIMLTYADALISVSREDLLAINRVFKIERKKDIYYVPNVINTENFRRIGGVKREYIGFIGRLTHIKGIDLFLQLIQRYNEKDKNQRFLIIGQGPENVKVKDSIQKYPITFFKSVPHENMPDMYNKCILFTLISRAEGLPTTILESLACEVPVVAADIGGIKEIVMDGKTGYLFKSGDIDGAINKILKLISNNKLEEFGRNGRDFVVNEFSWKSIISKIMRIYNNLILLKRKSKRKI